MGLDRRQKLLGTFQLRRSVEPAVSVGLQPGTGTGYDDYGGLQPQSLLREDESDQVHRFQHPVVRIIVSGGREVCA